MGAEEVTEAPLLICLQLPAPSWDLTSFLPAHLHSSIPQPHFSEQLTYPPGIGRTLPSLLCLTATRPMPPLLTPRRSNNFLSKSSNVPSCTLHPRVVALRLKQSWDFLVLGCCASRSAQRTDPTAPASPAPVTPAGARGGETSTAQPRLQPPAAAQHRLHLEKHDANPAGFLLPPVGQRGSIRRYSGPGSISRRAGHGAA